MEIFTDLPGQLQRLPLAVVVMLASVAVGLMLRRSQLVPEKYILLIVVPFNSLFYWLMGDPGTINFKTRHPELVLILYGLIFGMAAWAGYRPIAKKFFPEINGNGTTTFTKPKDPKDERQPTQEKTPPPPSP